MSTTGPDAPDVGAPLTGAVPGGPPGRPGLFDLQAFLRKFIPFSQSPIKHGLKSGRGQYLTLTFGAAHTDTTFAHTLGHTPEQVIVVQAPRPTPATATVGGTLTFGTHLTGGSYNGTADVTLATDATNANTASTIVARDASGNFTAGTITAALTGNADTATKLATARAINTVNFDGSAAITIKASTTNVLTFGTHLTSGGSSFDGSAAVTITSDATSANTASTIVARDASGNFSMGALTATTVNASGLGTFVGLTAGTGTVKGASDGATVAFHPPLYNHSGAAAASTTHIVSDTTTGTGTGATQTLTITLTGAAVFAALPTYAVCYVFDTASLLAPAVSWATLNSTGSSLLFQFTVANGHAWTAYYFAIGA